MSNTYRRNVLNAAFFAMDDAFIALRKAQAKYFYNPTERNQLSLTEYENLADEANLEYLRAKEFSRSIGE